MPTEQENFMAQALALAAEAAAAGEVAAATEPPQSHP